MASTLTLETSAVSLARVSFSAFAAQPAASPRYLLPAVNRLVPLRTTTRYLVVTFRSAHAAGLGGARTEGLR